MGHPRKFSRPLRPSKLCNSMHCYFSDALLMRQQQNATQDFLVSITEMRSQTSSCLRMLKSLPPFPLEELVPALIDPLDTEPKIQTRPPPQNLPQPPLLILRLSVATIHHRALPFAALGSVAMVVIYLAIATGPRAARRASCFVIVIW